MQNFEGVELIDIPSGMGGTLPAAIAADHGEELDVICLHHEFFPNWVLTVKRADTKPWTWGALNNRMKKIIRSRKVTA
jgi:hypothetical protein